MDVPKFPASKRYLKIHEIGLYRMIKRRQLKLEEMAIASYLRGKFLRFNINPFYLTDATIIEELQVKRNTLRRIRKLLQCKGIIEFDVGNGKNHATTYTMLDAFMASPRNGVEPKESVDEPLKESVRDPLSNVLSNRNEIKRKRTDYISNTKTKRQNTTATPINDVVNRIVSHLGAK